MKRKVTRTRFETLLIDALDSVVLLLDAGIPLADALTHANQMVRSRHIQAYFSALSTALMEGQDGAHVWAHSTPLLLQVFLSTSEETGKLSDALRTWCQVARQQRTWRMQMFRLASYPLMLSVLTSLLMTFLLTKVVPTFLSMYRDLGLQPPQSTMLWMTVGRQFVVLFWCSFGFLAIGFAVGRTLQQKAPETWYRYTRRAPWQWYVLRSQTRWFCLFLGTMADSGIPVMDALERLCSPSQPWWCRRMASDGRDRLLQGQTLTEALGAGADSLMKPTLRLAEQTGDLAETLLRLERTLRALLTHALERILRIAQPVLLGMTGLMVAASMLLLFVPMYDVITQISQGGS